MPSKSRIEELFERLVCRQASAEELEELSRLLFEEEQIDRLNGLSARLWEQIKVGSVQYPVDWDTIYTGIIKHRNGEIKRMNVWRKIAVAASVVLVLGLSAYFLFIKSNGNKAEPLYSNTGSKEIAAPSKTKATITLADGSKVSLDSVSSGRLAQQGDVSVIKTAEGQINYQLASGSLQQPVQYNTLSNPRGSNIATLRLGDGTVVWLNAASSLTYPVAFTGNGRKVSITGEAYFEVAKNKSNAFLVDVDGRSTVKVLGTHFNVNAYEDESSIKTTLLEGSVRVATIPRHSVQLNEEADSVVILKPGQQAVIATSANQFQRISVVNNPDIEQVVAWKNGVFNFNGADLRTIMRQLEKWYDIKVEFKGAPSDETFKGEMYRSVSLPDVLEMFRKMDVRSELKGRNLTIF